MLVESNLTVHDDEMTADAHVVSAGLDSFNHSVAPLHQVLPLACFARLSDGAVIGGAVGRTWGRCCELMELWVHQNHRSAGIGKRLMQQFQARATERGCSVFYLTTFSFQAPAFYKALGYKVEAEVRGFPGDIAKYTMVRVVT